MFRLPRNVASSIGISIVTVFWAGTIQINHAVLSAFNNRYLYPFSKLQPPQAQTPKMLDVMDKLVKQQAAKISS